MIVSWGPVPSELAMPEDILVELQDVVASHPWWQARSRLTVRLLKAGGIGAGCRVLDAGCGWGVTLAALERAGFAPVGLDVSLGALQRLDRSGRHLVHADITEPIAGSVEPFDAVIALDVIEHIDDDRLAVTALGKLAKPGGLVLVSVPARPDLFSEFDDVQGHRRRYLADSLRAAFEGSGLVIERLLWWGAWLVPLLKLRSRASHRAANESAIDAYRRYLRLPPWPGVIVLRLAFAVDEALTLAALFRTGTSLIAIARRAASDGSVGREGPIASR